MVGRGWSTLLGVPITLTGQSWQFVPPKIVIGIIVALIALPQEVLAVRMAWGVIFGILLLVILFLHIIGHILSSKLVAPPMTEAHITTMLIQTLYGDDPPDVPGKVHVIRSLGGPVTNIGLGVVTLVDMQTINSPALAFFAGANFVLAALVLLPFPTVDGEVIWREIGRWIARRSS